MTEHQIIIIGGGPAGYNAAFLAAEGGMDVAVIESRHMGGTCLNCGCIPTKAYARSAEVAMLMRRATEFGMATTPDVAVSLPGVLKRKDSIVAAMRQNLEQQMQQKGITILHGEAVFADANTVEVATADDTPAQRLTAPHIIVATGATPVALPGINVADSHDSESLLAASELSHSLCIIGAGVIGMEFASIFSAFGHEVAVVEMARECLPMLDSELARRLRRQLEHRGVTFYLQSKLEGTAPDGQGLTISRKGKTETISCGAVLTAVGRRPQVFQHFSKAGFEYDGRRGITVNENYQTTIPHIYAIGDVNGQLMLAHETERQAAVAVGHILGQKPLPRNHHHIPAAIFTMPEAAYIGHGEQTLKESGTPYECRKALFRSNGKAQAMGEDEGMLKLFSEPGAGVITGCHAVGPHAADMVQEVAALMACNATVDSLRNIVHIHPTLSEILQHAARQ